MKVTEEDLKIDELPLFDVVEADALEIIGSRNGLYLMKYLHRMLWLSLSKDNPFVKDFEKHQKTEETDELPIITTENVREWMEDKIWDEKVEADF